MLSLRCLIVCLGFWIYWDRTLAQTSNSFRSDLNLVKTIVLFRHGMRAPLRQFQFDTYAKTEKKFWPEGLGALVNEGKLQMYQLGTGLRKRYENLLIPYEETIAKDVQMITTAVDRCYQSGALVLAGFYPPNQQQIWNEELLWQPVPIRSPSPDKVHIIRKKEKCASYNEDLSNVSKEWQNNTNVNYLINFLSNLTREDNITSAYDVFHVGDYLLTKKSLNLTIPDWVDEEFSTRLNKFYVESFGFLTRTSKMRQLLAGPLIKDIIHRIQDVIYNRPSNSKFYFYSGHDSSLTSLLDGLNLERNFVPTYGASLIFEIYRSSSNNYLIRTLFSDDYSLSHINVKVLPNCEEYCPMGKFVQIYEKYLTQDWEKECNS